ncbi:hypothetical protein [Rubellimicrobium arenae]|uniref:hypothetical protein n=1 Tax=Rubellimicrobium arenae TaxID=2817372 RepID=UPI001B309561|nr:hypothetical protein [Rubellimicrobium arenae]
MARLILFLMLFAALALAVAAAATAFRALTAPSPAPLPVAKEDKMPKGARTLAYGVLLVLLLGLTSGWLGPA